MKREMDIVESLIRSAGRRVDPPDDAYRQVLASATDAFRRKSARQRQRRWVAAGRRGRNARRGLSPDDAVERARRPR